MSRVAVWGDIPGVTFDRPLGFDLLSPALDHSGWAAHRCLETAMARLEALHPRTTMQADELYRRIPRKVKKQQNEKRELFTPLA